MNQLRSRNWGELLILLLLPAPLVAIAIILGLVLLIANPDAISLGGDDPEDTVAFVEAEPTLHPNAAALATLNALPERVIPTPQPAPAASSEEAVEIAAELGYSPATIESGEVNYLSVCTACHGIDARGVVGLGKTLLDSEFVRGMSDDELIAFVIEGRQVFDPLNTTGVAMPPRGGNPGLTDDDIYEIVAYIRFLDGHAGPAGGVVAAAPEGEAAAEVETPAETDGEAEEPAAFDAGAMDAIVTGGGGGDETATEPEAAEEPATFDAAAMDAIVTGGGGDDEAETPAETTEQPETVEEPAAEPAETTADPVEEPAAAVEEPLAEGVEFTEFDVDALLASLGVVLPDPVPQPVLTGEQLYQARCAICHGESGEGIEGRGGDLRASDLLSEGDNAAIFHMLRYGSPVWADENVSGFHMPERGGYPYLSDEQIESLIDYLQTLTAE